MAEKPAEEWLAEHRGSRSAEMGGLFTGFEGYRTPTKENYEEIFRAGLVVPDTNVLLNLYRYNPDTQSDFFNVLERLGDQLWVPHQVLVEFWRNREAAIRDPQDTADKTVEALGDLFEKVTTEVRRWVNRVALPPERLAEMELALGQSFAVVSEVIIGSAIHRVAEEGQDTNSDVVLNRLASILEGRVGQPLEPTAHVAAVAEGQRRVMTGLPPGYLDSEKNKKDDGDRAAGDFIVWEQVLCEAERRRCDVLLVTGDVKDDWWRRDRGQARGPRVELVEEMRKRSGQRLFMLRPDSLLLHARSLLDVAVREGSLQDVERVDRTLGGTSNGGWTLEAISRLMDTLWHEGGVQWMAICFASVNGGGFISRDNVYDLGEYDDNRTLRGFTRPANRLAQRLRESGSIPPNAVDVLEAVYDTSFSAVQASGFRVPEEVVQLVRAYVEGTGVDADDYMPHPRSVSVALPALDDDGSLRASRGRPT